jgi:uncharacterized RDD family membrane protein YckC
MKCQNCEAETPEEAERCENCGAKLLHRRVVLGLPRKEEFNLTAEAEPGESDEREEPEWPTPVPSETLTAAGDDPLEAAPVILYGGFFRRLGAFLVDILLIVLLSGLMGIMAYVAYKVGLAAHARRVSWDNAGPLMVLLTAGWIALAASYFIAFHGMVGQTIGKWMFSLRVVGSEQQPISYRRALLRWIGMIGLGCASIGLSFLWILWSREKRAWHDYLARTWVIHE